MGDGGRAIGSRGNGINESPHGLPASRLVDEDEGGIGRSKRKSCSVDEAEELKQKLAEFQKSLQEEKKKNAELEKTVTTQQAAYDELLKGFTTPAEARDAVIRSAAINLAAVGQVESNKQNELYTPDQNNYTDEEFVGIGAFTTLLRDILVEASRRVFGGAELSDDRTVNALAFALAASLQLLFGSRFLWHRATALQLAIMSLAGPKHRNVITNTIGWVESRWVG